ncbi:hypothetical protein L7F22_063283 [Adiantum nelumboides]|nr:hypothetical protein [Adiantum nelumboides]
MFRGHNTMSNTRQSSAVDGEWKITSTPSIVSVSVCLSIGEVKEALEAEQPLATSFRSPGPIVDEKLRLILDQSITTHSACIVFHAKRTETTETMTDQVHLRDNLQPPSTREELRDFFRDYGDAFVSSRATGGEYNAVLTYYAATKEEQSQLSSSMRAAGIFTGANIDASLQANLNRFNSSQNIHNRVSFAQNIFGVQGDVNLPNMESLIAFANAFPSMPLHADSIVAQSFLGYEHVPEIASKFASIARNRDLLIHFPSIGAFLAFQNDVNYIKRVYELYGAYGRDTRLMQVKREVDEDAQAIGEAVKAFDLDPTDALIRLPSLNSLNSGTPSMHFSSHMEVSPNFGEEVGRLTNGSRPFEVPALAHSIEAYARQETSVSEVQILWNDFRISGLGVTYTNVNKGGTLSLIHGGSGAENSSKMELLASHSLQSFDSLIWTDGVPRPIISQLSIKRSDNVEIVGAGLYPMGSRLTWTVPDGYFVLGFQGHESGFLGRFEVVCGSCLPTSWTI